MWDGDPVSLHPHTPVESARRYVDLIGADKIMAEGQRAFDAGRLPVGRRDPAQAGVRRARQPGGPRAAGRRLRADGLPDRGPAVARHLPHRRPRAARRRAARRRSPPPARTPSWPCRIDILFDFAAVHVIGERGRRGRPPHRLHLHRPATRPGRSGSSAACSTPAAAHPRTPSSPSPGPRPRSSACCSSPPPPAQLAQAGKIKLDGDEAALDDLAGVLDDFDPNFNIVTP